MRKLATLLALTALFTGSAHAQYVSVDYLDGDDGVDGYRFAYSPWETTFSDLPIVGDVDMALEFSAAVWNYDEGSADESAFVLAATPVFTKTIGVIGKHPVYLEAAIGISVMDTIHFADKDLSSHYQFEDRFGIGMKFGQRLNHRVALRYFHYSNAGFDQPNPGMDFFNLSYNYSF